MARRLSSDEDVERLLKLLDPLDRDVLSVESVQSARDALGDAVMREVRRSGRPRSSQHASRSRGVAEGRAGGVERRPRSLGRRAGRRRLARSGAVVALAAGVLTAGALLPSGGESRCTTRTDAGVGRDRA